MFKHTTKIFALLIIFASIVMFNGCQDKQSITSPDAGTKILSKDLSFTMPAGASLVSANLKLYTWSSMGATHNVDVHSITSPWSCPVSWNSLNGAFNSAAITTFDMAGLGWKTINITSTVQSWLNGDPNYGLLLKNHDLYAGVNKLGQFLSNEYLDDPTLRPYLEIVTTAGTFEIEPLEDTYINSIDPGLSFCSEEKLYIGYVDLGTGLAEKRPLLKFDITPTQTENCETAYAFGNAAECFLTLSPIAGNNWGWTNVITPGYSGSWPMYAGAGQCDISKGTLVGHVNVSYIAGTITIDYVLDAGFNLSETHVWIGTTKLPVKNGVYQTAPGKFNYNGQDPVVLTGQTGNKYVAVHAGVCWFE